ncbi:MAG: hypothetical protein K8T89_00375 [Planctomycetes bacterium]|nr:hypothetical protein [Planctomycetota bacterium]
MPKRITLKMKDANIEDIVKELAKQSGYKLQFQGGQQRRMTIEMENVTYWQAMEKLCNEAGLSPGFEEQQGIVYLYQQNTVSPYTHHTGPFRFVAQNFNYSRYVNLANIPRTGTDANQQDNNSLSFGFMIQSEPKSPLLAVGPPRLTKAEDENGVSLLPRTNDQQQFNVQYNEGNGLYRNFQHSVGVQLAKPVKDAARVKIIQGKVLVTLLSGTKADVVIDNLAVGKKKLVGTGANAEITIEDISEQNKVWTLTLLIKRIAKQGEHDYNWMNSLQQKMELQDAKGRKYQSNGVSNYINTSETSVHAAYQFSMPPNAELGPAVKLVLSRWLTISQEVEFEFKDLPLP